MVKKSITYADVGDNYDTKDPIKVLAQNAAYKTSDNLLKHTYFEIADTRGESAFVWQQGNILMASVIEGLGTKNLIADEMRKINGKTYYDVIAHDTVATIINDLITVGAAPLVINAYWAIEDNSWLQDKKRMNDLINGWKDACNISGVTWGGGETPTLKGIMKKNVIELGGSATGVITSKKSFITDKKLKNGDQILLLKSNGINANGVSLVRAIGKKLSQGYATKLQSGQLYGEAVLSKSNIYAKLIQELLDKNIALHYIANITGHGLRKIMRARQNFTYILEKIVDPQELFIFMQKKIHLSDYEMYATFNMGMDFALFVPEKDRQRAQQIIKQNNFESIHAGYIENGKKQVIIKPKNIVYKGETLKVR